MFQREVGKVHVVAGNGVLRNGFRRRRAVLFVGFGGRDAGNGTGGCNIGCKSRMVFPQGHPYYKRLPKEQEHLLQEKSRAEVRRILDNAEQYRTLKANPDYKDVDFDWKTGGLKATHKDHNFDKVGGQYELEAQRAEFKDGNKVIFGSEKGGVIGQKYIEGLWNDHSFEIGSSLGTGKNNIKGILNHCKDKEAEVAVIYFPKPELYSFERLKNGIKRYNGQTDHRFKEIIYIVDGKVNSYK